MNLMEAGQSMIAIDEMDVFFYFDCLINRNIKEEKRIIKDYDNKGL